MSVIRVAKLVNARRAVTEHLATRRCPYPDEAARDVIDALLNLGWTYPGWRDDEDIPRPSHSTPTGRAEARRIYQQAINDRKAAR